MIRTVEDRIRHAIRDHGPIGFDEFMELALYGPGGYYERPPVGEAGDFVTSPHVHPVFGTLLGRAVRSLLLSLGERRRYRVTEVGAGDGTLARQLMAELSDLEVRYTAVERSEGAREALARIDGVEVESALPGELDLLVANELLDNLPFRRVRGDREVAVGIDHDGFVEVDVAWPGEPGPPGQESIVPVGAFAFVDEIVARLARGYAILIDYGGVGSTGGEIHGYRGQRVVEDVLAGPGTADITSGIDFELIAGRARAGGLVAFPTITQRDALLGLGFDAWMRGDLERQTALLDRGEGIEAVRSWSGRSRATLLVDEAALGRLRWLVLATPGLPRPSWLP